MDLLGMHCHDSDMVRQYGFYELEGRSGWDRGEPCKDGLLSSENEIQVMKNLIGISFFSQQNGISRTFSASFAAGLIEVVPLFAGASTVVGISRDFSD